MKIYLVGGAVRDQLLGLKIRERDWVVVGATPEQMLAQGYIQVGRDFPVFLHPKTHEEYALARTERKTAPGYRGFCVQASPEVTLEQDLKRRDLTINAMAQDENGEIIDPFRGREDLRKGLLRHVSPAFTEDPVRVLRLARFAARFARWGFRVAHGTHALMKKMVSQGEVDALVAERVWKETSRALEEERPTAFFEVLNACGALSSLFPEFRYLFPEVAGHGEKNYSAPLSALDKAAQLDFGAQVRFAVLCAGFDKEKGWLEQLAQRLKLPKSYVEIARLAIAHRPLSDAGAELKAEQVLLFLEQSDAFRHTQRFDLLLQVFTALGMPEQTLLVIRDAYRVATAIKAQVFIEQGIQGAAIKQALHDSRLQAIAVIRK